MARTVRHVIDSAKNTLNDKNLVYYPEPELLGYVVDALNTVKNMRPDLFVGRFNESFSAITTASSLPLDDQFFRPVVDYVIARAETKDADHVESGRVELMARLTTGYLS